MNHWLTCLLLLPATISVGQRNWCDSSNLKRVGGFSEPTGPYDNWNLCTRYDTSIADFSQEFLKLETARTAGAVNCIKQFDKVDCSSLWLSGQHTQFGVLGSNYELIRFYVSSVQKDKKNPRQYHVHGKTIVEDSIAGFSGTILLQGAYMVKRKDYDDWDRDQNLLYSYHFKEDKRKNFAGEFRGNGECFLRLSEKKRTIRLDSSGWYSDGGYNRSFVGTWKSYRTGAVKKCIWGDGKLPFTFDFDLGTGDIGPNPKYKTSGWQAYGKDESLSKRWW